MRTIIKIGVIGSGFWGRNHARVLKEINDAELVFIADIDVSKAEEIGKRFNVEFFKDYKEALSKHDVDAVTICTPTSTHYEIAMGVIKRGINVLIEKPVTGDLMKALRLSEAARDSKIKTMPGFIERFNPAVNYLKQLIDKGKIGHIITIIAERVSRRPDRIKDVGVLHDLGMHDIDVIRYITNKQVKSVYSIIGKIQGTYEDYALMILNLEDNITSFISTNWLTPRKIRTLKVTGSEGIITIDYITQEITIENNEGTIKPYIEYSEPLKRELQHFINVIKGEKPLVTLDDAIIALSIIDSALKSAKTGIPEMIPDKTINTVIPSQNRKLLAKNFLNES
ncbi:MAG: Gfo/Idh/MocA family oxidoreductase [Thermoprotei archaeon]